MGQIRIRRQAREGFFITDSLLLKQMLGHMIANAMGGCEEGDPAPLVTFAKRTTFVIGAQRRVLHVDRGGAAVSTDGAIAACKLS